MNTPLDNLQVVRHVYEMWNRAPEEAVAGIHDFFAADVEWSSPHPDAGELRGRDAVANWIASYSDTFQDFRHTPEELRVLRDGRVLAFFTETGQGSHSGAGIRVEGGAVWTLRDGEVIRFEAFLDRRQALEVAGMAPEEDGVSD